MILAGDFCPSTFVTYADTVAWIIGDSLTTEDPLDSLTELADFTMDLLFADVEDVCESAVTVVGIVGVTLTNQRPTMLFHQNSQAPQGIFP